MLPLRLPLLLALALMAPTAHPASAQSPTPRPRAREAGVVVGIFEPGPVNAITDVAGVRVGQVTRIEGAGEHAIRTGVTAVLPHGGNLFQERVPAAIHVGNAFGKLLGSTQVRELGELETPILLTCTLCVWRAADAMVEWLLRQPGMENVGSINPVVGETNDGFLNDIRARPIRAEDVVAALEGARTGPVEEGAVGAGTGTIAFGFKAGIGTSSRRLPAQFGGYTLGVLVQTNFGGILTINGAPVGRELGRFAFQQATPPPPAPAPSHRLGDRGGPARDDGTSADGSIMIVLATDAPLDARNLDRLAARALAGLARTGSSMSNGSGDYVIAFSTAESVRRRPTDQPRTIPDLPNDAISPLFEAAIEATEEAIYDSLFRAVTMTGVRGTVEALPLEPTLQILKKYNALHWDRTLPPQNR
jgi:D-aminopeptidase